MNTHTLRDIKTVSRPQTLPPVEASRVEATRVAYPEPAEAESNAPPLAMAEPSRFLEQAPFFLMLVLTFLLPLFVVPSSNVNFNLAKMLFATLSIDAALGVWIFGRLKSGVFTVPRTALSLTVFLLPLSFAVAALFSDAPAASFIGQGFEPGTVFFFGLCAVVFFLGATLFQSRSRVFAFQLTLLLAFAVMVLFQGSRYLFGYDFLSFGVFSSSIANLIGKWNDLGVYAGLMALLSLSAIELFDMRGMLRPALYSALGLALALLMVVNFRIVWVTLAVFAALLAAYVMRRSRASHDSAQTTGANQMPVVSFVVVGIAILFSLVGQPVGEWAARQLDISHLEARPSLVTTVGIARQAMTGTASIIFGVGPNRFLQQWLLYKPVELNLTPFWGTDFNYGVGWLPTFLITAGLIGALGLALFFVPFLRAVFRGFAVALSEPAASFPIVSSLLGALFLWTLVAVYIPNGVLIILAFLMSGVAVGTILRARGIAPRTFAFGVSKFGFIVSLLLVLGLGGIAWSGYMAITRFSAANHFAAAVKALESGETEAALAAGEEAVALASLDVHYRLLAQAGVVRMRELVAATSNGETAEEPLRAEFRATLEQAVENAKTATDLDANSYENWAVRGLVYGILVPFGVEGAYDNSESAYRRAMELNPKNPALYLALARVTLEKGDFDTARTLTAEALTQKANYTEAAFFLSQLEVRAGNLTAAKESASQAVALNPDDPLALFQLGILEYNDEAYAATIPPLERAVSVNSSYSNARYFLGLSYSHEGRTDDAIAQFVEIEKFNKDNAEVKSILANLRAGKQPFAGEDKPEPEDRDKLPLKDEE